MFAMLPTSPPTETFLAIYGKFFFLLTPSSVPSIFLLLTAIATQSGGVA